MSKQYKITIHTVETLNRPFEADFGRLNILLGSNGTGKSKILRSLAKNYKMFDLCSEVIYVEGGRALSVPSSFANNKMHQSLATLDHASESHQKKKAEKLSSRILDAIIALDKKGEAEYRYHSNAVHKWQSADSKEGAGPVRKELPLQKLSDIFKSIFPEINVFFNEDSKSISCIKNDSISYSPNDLSDGEKQVFCLIADILLLGNEKSLIIVDEPELNLNPSLAINLWNLIENELPNAIFIYATHSIAFALRDNIDSLITLSHTDSKLISNKDFSEINQGDLKYFLGAIPAILAKSKAIVVEGEKKSLDSIFYKWLINSPDVAIENVGSCNNVLASVKRDGVWKTLGESQKIAGIIDRDYKLDDLLNGLEESNVLAFPFHEIESIFLIPKIVALLSERLGTLDEPINEEIVKKIIIEEWEQEYIKVAAKRTTQHLEKNFTPSLTRVQLSDAKDETQKLKMAIIESYQNEIVKLTEFAHTIEGTFEKILAQCKQALDTKDIDMILKLMPGKLIHTKIVTLLGLKSSEHLARAVTKFIKVEEIPELISFKIKLMEKLNL